MRVLMELDHRGSHKRQNFIRNNRYEKGFQKLQELLCNFCILLFFNISVFDYSNDKLIEDVKRVSIPYLFLREYQNYIYNRTVN